MCLLVLSLVSESQAMVGFGLKGGMNSSKIIFSPAADLTNQDYLKGLSFGAFMNFRLGPISIQPEILYSRRGLEFQLPVITLNYAAGSEYYENYTAKLEYLEIPILLKLEIMPAGPLKVYVFGGPSYGLLLKARLTRTYEGTSETEDIKSDFKNSSLAIVGGLGVDIKVPLLFKVTIDARYHYGLFNILSDTSSLKDITDKARNNGFSIMAGISF